MTFLEYFVATVVSMAVVIIGVMNNLDTNTCVICAILSILATMGIFALIRKNLEKKAQQEEEAERERKRAERAKPRKKIEDWASTIGKYDECHRLTMRVVDHNEMGSAIAMAKVYGAPSAPTYQRGVVEGSLADQVAQINNHLKKQEYEQKLDEHNKRIDGLYKSSSYTSTSSATSDLYSFLRSNNAPQDILDCVRKIEG